MFRFEFWDRLCLIAGDEVNEREEPEHGVIFPYKSQGARRKSQGHPHPAASRFVTDDYGLFLPPNPENLVQAWAAGDDARCELWSTDEPLDRPRDRWLAERIIERRALTRVTGTAT